MKHNLAIAYSMQRRKKMAAGGQLDSGYLPEPKAEDAENRAAEREDLFGDELVDRVMAKRYSEGGRVANGGMADLEKLADSRPNEFDDLALRDDLESTNSGATSGDFLGNAQQDEDRADIVARVMRQRSMKQRNPRPA